MNHKPRACAATAGTSSSSSASVAANSCSTSNTLRPLPFCVGAAEGGSLRGKSAGHSLNTKDAITKPWRASNLVLTPAPKSTVLGQPGARALWQALAAAAVVGAPPAAQTKRIEMLDAETLGQRRRRELVAQWLSVAHPAGTSREPPTHHNGKQTHRVLTGHDLHNVLVKVQDRVHVNGLPQKRTVNLFPLLVEQRGAPTRGVEHEDALRPRGSAKHAPRRSLTVGPSLLLLGLLVGVHDAPSLHGAIATLTRRCIDRPRIFQATSNNDIIKPSQSTGSFHTQAMSARRYHKNKKATTTSS
jgi:hypothetical protein